MLESGYTAQPVHASAESGSKMLGQKHTGLPPALFEIFASITAVKPCCPQCSATPRKNKRAVRWAMAYGHRCSHGAPCASFGRAFGEGCPECAASKVQLAVHEAQSA